MTQKEWPDALPMRSASERVGYGPRIKRKTAVPSVLVVTTRGCWPSTRMSLETARARSSESSDANCTMKPSRSRVGVGRTLLSGGIAREEGRTAELSRVAAGGRGKVSSRGPPELALLSPD